jgi:hypothetical protein
MADAGLLGAFDTNSLTGIYQPKIADYHFSEPRFGLNLQVSYLYGGLRSESGRFSIVERKFISSMTGGLFIMSNDTGSMELDAGTPRSARGEVRRIQTADELRWHDPIMQRVPDDIRVPEEQGLDLRVTDGRMEWSEGSLLTLEGDQPAAGVQFYSPMRGNNFYYISQPYWLTGEILGERAEGPVFLDHIYWQPHGLEWKETPFYTERQVSWMVFANKLDDGSVQAGHVVRCTDGLSFVAIAENGGPAQLSDRMDVSMTLDDDDYVTGAEYDIEGTRWTYTEDADGHMEGHSKARWSGYRAQGGMFKLTDDPREIVNGFCWVECFADRIRAEGLVK